MSRRVQIFGCESLEMVRASFSRRRRRSGQLIRVAGKGGEGLNGGSAGDIYLRVRYAQDPDWLVQGADLTGHLDLAPWEAVLGATVSVKTLEGSVLVKVPAGFQAGRKLRVRGQGLPTGAAKRGDLYVEATIQVPAHIGKEEEAVVAIDGFGTALLIPWACAILNSTSPGVPREEVKVSTYGVVRVIGRRISNVSRYAVRS